MIEGPIDFDPEKDAANRRKHGVSLRLARAFDATRAVVIVDARRDYGELRSVAYGKIAGRLYVMVFTRRDDLVRVISLRKANVRGVRHYGSG